MAPAALYCYLGPASQQIFPSVTLSDLKLLSRVNSVIVDYERPKPRSDPTVNIVPGLEDEYSPDPRKRGFC